LLKHLLPTLSFEPIFFQFFPVAAGVGHDEICLCESVKTEPVMQTVIIIAIVALSSVSLVLHWGLCLEIEERVEDFTGAQKIVSIC
jgi:hypothetical protein